MAVVNFSVCLVLILYQLSVALSDESSESADLGLNDPRVESDTDGVRCYCNTAQCVSTGYMCRSRRGGGCYSELPVRRHHARHGCLQHLADTEQDAVSHCQKPPQAQEHSISEVICCFKDLCNHEDSPLARARLNLTNDIEGSVASERGSYSGEVWFKAATIAVPVCGALILFLLVGVAIRLLRADALLQADRKLREQEAVSHCQKPPQAQEHSISEVICCFKDLCNHEDSPLARARLNLTNDIEGSVASERGSYSGEVWFKAATIAVPVCGALILFLLVGVAIRLLRADALLQADRKLRGGYTSPPQHMDDVKKVWVGNSPLLMSGCLVVERAQLVSSCDAR